MTKPASPRRRRRHRPGRRFLARRRRRRPRTSFSCSPRARKGKLQPSGSRARGTSRRMPSSGGNTRCGSKTTFSAKKAPLICRKDWLGLLAASGFVLRQGLCPCHCGLRCLPLSRSRLVLVPERDSSPSLSASRIAVSFPPPLALPCAIMNERVKLNQQLTSEDLKNCNAPKF